MLFALDRAQTAIEQVSLLRAPLRDGRRDIDEGHVLDAFQLVGHRLAPLAGNPMAKQLHVMSQRPLRRLHVRVARSLQANHQAKAVQNVLFLPLDPANVADPMIAAS